MSDYRKLIEEARGGFRNAVSRGWALPEEKPLAVRLADALEAAEAEADKWERAAHTMEVDRNRLRDIVRQARSMLNLFRAWNVSQPQINNLDRILSEADVPADQEKHWTAGTRQGLTHPQGVTITEEALLAALVESSRVEHEQYGIRRDFTPAQSLDDYDTLWVERMRAALAAALTEGKTDE